MLSTKSLLKIPYLLGPLILLAASLTSPAQTQPPIFPSPAVSSNPIMSGAAIGDFNGDGQSDQAYVSSLTAITVLLNQGPNNPPTQVVTSGLSCTPQTLVAGDLNNDKKPDVVLTCKEGYVAVLLGNGDGTFQKPSYNAIANVNNIAPPVDLNGDGYPDIVVTSAPAQTSGTPAVVLLLNMAGSAPGTLAAPVVYSPFVGTTVGTPFSSIITGDFNGDGKQDVVVASTALQVFYGNGDGTLQAAQDLGAPQGFSGVMIPVDINHDGFTDIAYITGSTFTTSPQSLQILLGSSNGQLLSGSSLALYASQRYGSIVPFQTRSNIVDLALVGTTATTIVLGDGDGNYTLGQSYGLTGAPVLPQTAANGDTNLLFAQANQTLLVTGNGDGTFQAPPTTFLEGTFSSTVVSPAPTSSFVIADLNNDGLTDVLSIDPAGDLIAALGRGNGTFYLTTQTANAGSLVVAGDFNGDGKTDVVTVHPGQFELGGTQAGASASYTFYNGDGDGTFQFSPSGVTLQVSSVESVVAGDFNGDKKLDLILFYDQAVADAAVPSGALFLAGNGDGTFSTPVALPLPQITLGSHLVADVNHDGKLDLLYANTVNLGNGDGTFTQQPLGLPVPILAIGDLNGDGNPDVVAGPSVYAGNGDGTFQTTPFYTASLPTAALITSASIGDLNADGHPDLLLQYTNTDLSSALSISLGDGAGNLTADPNLYSTGKGVYSQGLLFPATLARLNNQAPAPANDHAPDYLYGNADAVTSLINLLNPTPTTPPPVLSNTRLVLSQTNPAPMRAFTLTASVTGLNPSGSFTFTANGVSLGTVPIVRDLATLTVSLPAAGVYSITATYSGDTNNQASASTQSVTVALATTTMTASYQFDPGANQQVGLTSTVSGNGATGAVTFFVDGSPVGSPDLVNGIATLSYAFPSAGSHTLTATYPGDVANLPAASPATTIIVQVPNFDLSTPGAIVTISAGQSATTTLNIFPNYGYHGTVTFSCGPLIAGETCIFQPPTVTPPLNGMYVSSTFVITTTARTTTQSRVSSSSIGGVALAGIVFLFLLPKRLWTSRLSLLRPTLLALLVAAAISSLSGCSSSSPSSKASSPSGTSTSGTPAGVQTVTINAIDAASNLSQSVTVRLTIQ